MFQKKCPTITSSSNNKLSARMNRQQKHVEFFTTLKFAVTLSPLCKGGKFVPLKLREKSI